MTRIDNKMIQQNDITMIKKYYEKSNLEAFLQPSGLTL